MRYLFYDVETPNRRNDSICAVGWALYDGLVEVSQEYQLIDSRADFDVFNSRIHGIYAADVAGMPTFGEYWTSTLATLMSSAIVVAHNANFDMSVTSKALDREGTELPRVMYIDTLPALRALFPGQSCKLTDLAKMYGYSYTAHNAGEDAVILADILSAICMERDYDSFDELFDVANAKPQTAQLYAARPEPACRVSPSERYREKLQKIIDGAKRKGVDLTDIHFAFHGNLNNPELMRVGGLDLIVQALGGVYHASVSKKVDYLVCFDGEETGSVRKAKTLIDAGAQIQIIETDAFLNLIGYRVAEPNHVGPAHIRERKSESQRQKDEEARLKYEARQQKAAARAEREARKAQRQCADRHRHAVLQLTLDGDVVRQFSSVAEAAETLGINKYSIKDAARGKQKTAGGYRWTRVADDGEPGK